MVTAEIVLAILDSEAVDASRKVASGPRGLEEVPKLAV
jgi:hypothetical protein